MSGVDLLVWAATLLAFPLAGIAARAVVGPVDAVWTAVVAGAIAGAVIGTAQWLALRTDRRRRSMDRGDERGLAVGLGVAFACLRLRRRRSLTSRSSAR